jgi:hypothetical protein
MNSDKVYKDTIDLLKEAYDEFNIGTNNQEGMPSHLMRVARLFGEAKDNIAKLEKEALKQSKKWYRDLHYNSNSSSNNNSNNNNNSKRKTKKRKHNNNK